MGDILCHVLTLRNYAYKDEKPLITSFAAMRKSCIATNTWKYYLTRSSLVMCRKTCENMCRSFIMLRYDRMKEIKGFLLKIYLENHKPKVDDNASACTSTHQHAYQNSNWEYRERKHARSEKTKNSYISYFCVHIKPDAFEDKSKERLQNIYQC